RHAHRGGRNEQLDDGTIGRSIGWELGQGFGREIEQESGHLSVGSAGGDVADVPGEQHVVRFTVAIDVDQNVIFARAEIGYTSVRVDGEDEHTIVRRRVGAGNDVRLNSDG